jgi:pimeloyl-ACP methyl ester carboxylesterase
MNGSRFLSGVSLVLAVFGVSTSTIWAATPTFGPVEGFADVNGVRLEYLDWGGTGPTLVLVHGLADNPHIFDDLAPALIDRFHVVAYARRGAGNSEVKGPYDIGTLTEDLRGLMDALGIVKADLIGYSAGGDEITEMAAQYPERVDRIIYFESAYDWSDPEAKKALQAAPVGFFDPPASAMASLEAYRAYLKANMYPGLDDMRRVEANFRQKAVIQSDGTLKMRFPKTLIDMLQSAMWSNKHRDYTRIHCPALAIYSENLYDLQVPDAQRRSEITAYEGKYWLPFQARSMDRVRRELAGVKIVRVPGAHGSFVMTDRRQVADLVVSFLGGRSKPIRNPVPNGMGAKSDGVTHALHSATKMRYGRSTLAISLALLLSFNVAWAKDGMPGPRFTISFPGSVHPEPVTGRLFLMISRTDEPEVRLQGVGYNSPEIIAVDVKQLKPGEIAAINAEALGTPLRSLREVPAGDYYVQAVLSVYTEFHRADHHDVWSHMDQWEGQQFNRSPGNLYSAAQKVHLIRSGEYSVILNKVIPPVQPPADSEWVKYVRIQSTLLTKFWGRPIYLGAVVLLPKGYASNPTVRYPVIYYQRGHFNLTPPFDFDPKASAAAAGDRETQEEEGTGYETGSDFYQSWRSDHFPRMLALSFLDPTPFADWSGGVNSANNGPYGDAILTELVPYVEKQFRIIAEPYARILTGRASGGREALALQLMHPEFFGGAWIFHPWAFDFKKYFTLDIYKDDNAFRIREADVPRWAHNPSGWWSLERPMLRFVDGTPFASFHQVSQHDAVMASTAGGDCLGADDAILGPVGPEGYPKPLWDRATGKIDREVAGYWRDHGDLALYAQRNWATIGRALTGKLHFYAGEMDHFYRNRGVHDFEDILKTTQPSNYGATFEYASGKGDWQPMTNAELVKMMAEHIIDNAPKGANPGWQQE